jgi:endonuclease/exonuclease/phosphatase family metal-dependent hydrolase
MPRPELKFATFNLYNLQLPGEPMYGGKTYNQTQYDNKIEWTAEMLKRIDADIIGFQELWHPSALKAAFEAAGLDHNYNLATKHFPGSIANAAAVKKAHALNSKSWTKNFPNELVLKKRKSTGAGNVPDYKISVSAEYFSRAILKTKIKPKQGSQNAPEITFFVAHLKSKLPIWLDKTEANKPSIKRHQVAIGAALATIRRTAEAAAVRIMLTKEMSGNSGPVVLVGDLNDTEHSVTNTIITADPSYRLAVSSRAGSRSDVGLYSSSSLQEYRSLRDVNFTHGFKGRLETLDHILVSEQFYDYSKQRKWSFKEMRVYNDFIEDDDRASGDHGVVTSTFVFHPAK